MPADPSTPPDALNVFLGGDPAATVEERLRLLETCLSRLNDIVLLTEAEPIDADGPRILYVNDAFLRRTGYRREEVIGKTPRILQGPKTDRAQLDIIRQALKDWKPCRVEVINYTKAGEEFWLELDIVPVANSAGWYTHWVAVEREITERKQAEEERRRLEAQLQQAQKMEALGTLAGGIAHDFNNLLGAILGHLDLIRMDSREGQPIDESLAEIRRAGDRAKALVRQILAFSRQQPVDRIPLDLAPVVQEAVRFLRATLPAQVTLACNVEPGCPHVLADATQIHQILVNLGTNAWQAMQDRPGRIEIRLQSVPVDAAAATRIGGLHPGTHACLTMTDSGCGMDAATLRRIFEPFFTTKDVGQGTGLGLSVVHGIVRHHDGAIEVTSQPGAGSTFRVYLPACPAPARALRVSDEPVFGTGQHILFVDDEESLTRMMTRMLQRLGYRVTSFGSAHGALEALREDASRFDAMLVDHEMPGQTGLALAREALRLRADLPIVLCSGYLRQDVREAAAQAGIRQVLAKPCELVPLSHALAGLFAPRLQT